MKVGADRFKGMVIPFIYKQLTVNPDPHAIITGGGKTVSRRLYGQGSGPTSRKIIGPDFWRRGSIAPVVIDISLSPLQNRLIGQLFVVPISCLPTGSIRVLSGPPLRKRQDQKQAQAK